MNSIFYSFYSYWFVMLPSWISRSVVGEVHPTSGGRSSWKRWLGTRNTDFWLKMELTIRQCSWLWRILSLSSHCFRCLLFIRSTWLVLTRSTVWGEGEVSVARINVPKRRFTLRYYHLFYYWLTGVSACHTEASVVAAWLTGDWSKPRGFTNITHTELSYICGGSLSQSNSQRLCSCQACWCGFLFFYSTREDEQCFCNNFDHLSLQEIKSFSSVSAHCLLFHERMTISSRSQNLKCSVGGG